MEIDTGIFEDQWLKPNDIRFEGGCVERVDMYITFTNFVSYCPSFLPSVFQLVCSAATAISSMVCTERSNIDILIIVVISSCSQ